MNWLTKMERKFGKYAISNLPLYIIVVYGFGYIMNILKPEWLSLITLNPQAILHGQVWRIVSWVFVPESDMGLFFVVLFLFFYYSIGKSLEASWGKFLFNVFFFSGVILTVVGAFAVYGYFSLIRSDIVYISDNALALEFGGACPKEFGGSWFYYILASRFSTYYLNLSIFLAYAITYPNARVLLFFVVPIKVKVLGYVYLGILGFEILIDFVNGGFSNGFITLAVVGSSLLNVLLFYILVRNSRKRRFRETKMQKEFKKKVKEAETVAPVIRHKCAICGQTDVSNPNLSFRYCSKCNGNYEYCNEHLFVHKHVE